MTQSVVDFRGLWPATSAREAGLIQRVSQVLWPELPAGGLGRWHRLLPVPETASAATDLDLISDLQAIPDARMRHGVRIPAWYLLLVAVLGILSGCRACGIWSGLLAVTTPRSPSRLVLNCGGPHWIRRSATSSCRWMGRHSARRSVTGRSPRSLVVQRN